MGRVLLCLTASHSNIDFELLERVARIPASATASRLASLVRHLFTVTAGLESMVVGEEEIAGQVQRAAQRIRVYSATGRAGMFAAKYGVRPEHDLRAAVADADLVITCTSRYTLTTDDVAPAGPLLVVDLGLPRNVDPEVGRIPGVELLDLELIALHAPVPALADAAHEIVGGAAAEFADGLRTVLGVEPQEHPRADRAGDATA